VRRWPDFRAGAEAAILPLSSVMEVLSTPRHSAKYRGDYVSSAARYAPLFFETLRRVTGGAAFWSPDPPLP
jgi:hypothetical protein